MSMQDDFTDAERGYFGSRGRNTDALLAENKDNVQRELTRIRHNPCRPLGLMRRARHEQKDRPFNP